MSDEPLELSQEQLDDMQADVVALLKAWEDRGIPQTQGAQVLCANAHLTLLAFGARLGQVVRLLTQQWELHNGDV